MKKEQVIKMWKQGYTKKKIVEEYFEDYSREIILRSGTQKKPSKNTLKEQAQIQVERILLEWWRKEVLEDAKNK
jgi:hypothetical protein